MIALMMVAACLPEPTDITLSGQVLAAQDAEQGAPGIEVTAFDSELNEYSTAETDDEGRRAIVERLRQTSGTFPLLRVGDEWTSADPLVFNQQTVPPSYWKATVVVP